MQNNNIPKDSSPLTLSQPKKSSSQKASNLTPMRDGVLQYKKDQKRFLLALIPIETEKAIETIRAHVGVRFDAFYPQRVSLEKELNRLDETVKKMEREQERLEKALASEPRYIKISPGNENAMDKEEDS